jgi:hypothetical protein
MVGGDVKDRQWNPKQERFDQAALSSEVPHSSEPLKVGSEINFLMRDTANNLLDDAILGPNLDLLWIERSIDFESWIDGLALNSYLLFVFDNRRIDHR